MNLKSIRKEKGYTLKEVSEGTGLPERSLAYWEKGERQPAADVLPKLAEFFKISVDELLDVKTPNVPAVEEIFEERVQEGSYGWRDELIVPYSRVEGALLEEYDKVKKSFFKLGYFLTLISKYGVYKKRGYASITDYAEEKLGLGSTNTYNFMQVYERTKKWGAPIEMDKQYLPYNQSQLVEICRTRWATDDLLKRVNPTDSVKNIHEYVSLWNKTYDKKGTSPEGATVKEALEIAARQEERKNAIPTPTVVVSESNTFPGQTSMFDEDPEVDPSEEYTFVPQGESFSSGGVATAYVDMSEDPEDLGEDEREETFVQNDKPETSLKELFRKQVQEFLSEYDYRIELYGRAQGAYGFAGSLFDYLKGKGFFDKI